MNVWMKRGLMAAGVAYVIALVPASVRPTWTAAPFAKPNSQIVVPVSATNLDARMRNACRAPTLLRPIMGSAHQIRVLRTDDNGNVLSIRTLNCEPYVQ